MKSEKNILSTAQNKSFRLRNVNGALIVILIVTLGGLLFPPGGWQSAAAAQEMVQHQIFETPEQADNQLNKSNFDFFNSKYDLIFKSKTMQSLSIFDKLIKKAQENGSVSVIVGVRFNFTPEGDLTNEFKENQRANIKQNQDALLEKLELYNPKNIIRYETIPYLAMFVDAGTLEFMKTLYEVQDISEDRANETYLAESNSVVRAPQAWTAGFSGQGQVVAILDTGVDKNHPFLSGKVVSEACYSMNNAQLGVSSVCPGGVEQSTASNSGLHCTFQGCDHGTHVAGIAAGRATSGNAHGVARDANLVAIQVFSKTAQNTPNAYDRDIMRGLERVLMLKQGGTNIASANMSLGGGQHFSNCDTFNSGVTTAINNLRSAGVATVVSSGNNNYTTSIGYPACISSVVSVGNTGDGSGGSVVDRVYDHPQFGSNSASFLNLLAPGTVITSSVPGTGFGNKTGTSMAAPHVAGAWAILKQRSSTATVQQVLNALTTTGQSVTDHRGNNITKPRINIEAALQSLGGGCSISIGQGTSGSELAAFQNAYNTGGGQSVLGCATASVGFNSFTSFAGTVSHYQETTGGDIEYHVNGSRAGQAFAMVTPFFNKWALLGFNSSNPLGYPIGFISLANSNSCFNTQNRYQSFEGGSLSQHLSGLLNGSIFAVHGAIHRKWELRGFAGCPLGLPTSDETTAQPSGASGSTGKLNQFQGGQIYWKTNAPEAYEVHGSIYNTYVAMGGSASWLGLPTSDEFVSQNGFPRSNFEGGYITWNGSTYAAFLNSPQCNYSINPTSQSLGAGGGTGSVSVTTSSGCPWSAISNASWITINSGNSGSSNGSVGYSVTSNSGVARTGTITIANQTFTVSQSTGSSCSFSIGQGTSGSELTAFQNAYNISGGQSILGCATASVGFNSFISFMGTISHYQTMTGGDIEYHTNGSRAGQAFVLITPFYNKWASFGFTSNNPLGYPISFTSSATTNTCFGTQNRYQSFEGGSLEQHLSGSRNGQIFEVHGWIYNRWASNGFTGCPLGLPISDETIAQPSGATGRTGVLNEFEGGQIYYRNGDSAAYEVHGSIKTRYVSLGGSASWLGFPTSNEYISNGRPRSDFEAGYITTLDGSNYQAFSYTTTQCNYSISPISRSLSRFGGIKAITVTVTSGCSWTATKNVPWITITSGSSGSGSGTIRYSVAQNTGPSRTGIITLTANGQTRAVHTITQSSGQILNEFARTKFDFDGDGKADVSVFRPDNGVWYLQQSANGFTGTLFGVATDKIVPADYDGDGKTDIAVYRSGTWHLQRSQLGYTGVAFGTATDIPVPADFDGDGKAELAVFRPSNGGWYIYNLVNGEFIAAQFGQEGDIPVVGDYDGDEEADVAVFRNGTWYIQGSYDGFIGIGFGQSGDKPVVGDYDGDGKTDAAVFRPSNGVWYVQQSTAGFTGIAFGYGIDLPTPADYDGDGKTDVAVFRNGTWYLQRSTQGFTGVVFGAATDKPIPNAFVR